MPEGLHRFYGAGDLHFITFSCYRREGLLGSEARRDLLLAGAPCFVLFETWEKANDQRRR
jgi:hypothetical protein